MPLQDHFNPPLSLRRHWHSFHNAWATYIAADLNEQLPDGYFAEANVQFGIEIDVGAFDETGLGRTGADPGWTVPAPTITVPLTVLTDVVEVLVFSREAGPTLAAVIEWVSPSNKDRPAERDAFVSKCATFLRQGTGLVIVDVVTDRRANLHNELMACLRVPTDDETGASGKAELCSPVDRPEALLTQQWHTLKVAIYSAAYRPVEHNGQASLEVWGARLAIGAPLPTMPLWLRGGLCLPLNLDATYERTCREQRIPTAGG